MGTAMTTSGNSSEGRSSSMDNIALAALKAAVAKLNSPKTAETACDEVCQTLTECLKEADIQVAALNVVEQALIECGPSLKNSRGKGSPVAAKLLEVIFPLVWEGEKPVREVALRLVRMIPTDPRPACWAQLKADMQSKYCKSILNLVETKQSDWPALWTEAVQFFGGDLHTGAQLINQLLGVLERAYKHPDVEWTRIQAFQCWKTLIDSFKRSSLNTKRVQLILIPLRASNHRNEALTRAKYDTYAHLIRNLFPPNVFDGIKPFLSFCFSAPGDSLLSLKGYPSLQPLCFEALELAMTRCTEAKCLPKISKQIIQAFSQCLQLPHINKEVIIKCWTMLLENFPEFKGDSNREVVRDVLSMLDELVASTRSSAAILNRSPPVSPSPNVSTPQNAAVAPTSQQLELGAILGDMISELVVGPNALSPGQLAAVSLYVGNDVMTGTPALMAVQWLLSAGILHSVGNTDQYKTTMNHLINTSTECLGGPLAFITKILKYILVTVLPQAGSDNSNVTQSLATTWCFMAEVLIRWVNAGGELNEGNAANHDFSCLYSVVQFPVTHLYQHLNSWTRVWGQLYQKAAPQVALASTTGTHEFCDRITASLTAAVRYDPDSKVVDAQLTAAIACGEAMVRAHKATNRKWGREQQNVVLLLSEASASAALLSEASKNTSEELMSAFARCVSQLHNPVPPASSAVLVVENLSPVARLLMRYPAPSQQLTQQIVSALNALQAILETHWQFQLNPPADVIAALSPVLDTAKNHSSRTIRTAGSLLASAISGLSTPDENSSSDIRIGHLVHSPAVKASKSPKSPKSPASLAIMKSTPVKTPPPMKRAAKRKLEEPDGEFVVIKRATPVKMVLTEHQKEVLKQRKADIPALYQDLSQDTQSNTQDCVFLPSSPAVNKKPRLEPTEEAAMDFGDVMAFKQPASPKELDTSVSIIAENKNVSSVLTIDLDDNAMEAPASDSISGGSTAENGSEESDIATRLDDDEPVKILEKENSKTKEATPNRRKSIVPAKKEPTVTRSRNIKNLLITRSGKMVTHRQSLGEAKFVSPPKRRQRKSLPPAADTDSTEPDSDASSGSVCSASSNSASEGPVRGRRKSLPVKRTLPTAKTTNKSAPVSVVAGSPKTSGITEQSKIDEVASIAVNDRAPVTLVAGSPKTGGITEQLNIAEVVIDEVANVAENGKNLELPKTVEITEVAQPAKLGGRTLRRNRSNTNLDEVVERRESAKGTCVKPQNLEVEGRSKDLAVKSSETVELMNKVMVQSSSDGVNESGKTAVLDESIVESQDIIESSQAPEPPSSSKLSTSDSVMQSPKLSSAASPKSPLTCIETPSGVKWTLKVSDNFTPVGITPPSSANQSPVVEGTPKAAVVSRDGPTSEKVARRLIGDDDRSNSMPNWMHAKKVDSPGKLRLVVKRLSAADLIKVTGQGQGQSEEPSVSATSPPKTNEPEKVISPLQSKRLKADPGASPASIHRRSGRAAHLLGLGQAAAARSGEEIRPVVSPVRKEDASKDPSGVTNAPAAAASTANVNGTAVATTERAPGINSGFPQSHLSLLNGGVLSSPTVRRRTRMGIAARFSDGGAPITLDVPGAEWVRKTYQPDATPDASILKKPKRTAAIFELDDSPSSKKKRVSFRDPPVSKSLNFYLNVDEDCSGIVHSSGVSDGTQSEAGLSGKSPADRGGLESSLVKWMKINEEENSVSVIMEETDHEIEKEENSLISKPINLEESCVLRPRNYDEQLEQTPSKEDRQKIDPDKSRNKDDDENRWSEMKELSELRNAKDDDKVGEALRNKRADEARLEEEERRKREEEERLKLEEEERMKEAEAVRLKKKEEEKLRKMKEEEDRLKKEEGERIKKEELERMRREEEERKKKEEEARLKAEEERKKKEDEARLKAEEERKKKEEEARLRAEEDKKKKEEEARLRAEEDRKKKEEEARLKAEEERKKRVEEARLKAEEERKKRVEEARLKAEDEKKKREEEARLKAEEERKEKEEARLKADEERKKKEEARLKAEEDRKKKEEEARLRADEERKKKEEERVRKEEEERLKRETEEAARKLQQERMEAEEKVKKAREETLRKENERVSRREELKRKREVEQARKKAILEERMKKRRATSTGTDWKAGVKLNEAEVKDDVIIVESNENSTGMEVDEVVVLPGSQKSFGKPKKRGLDDEIRRQREMERKRKAEEILRLDEEWRRKEEMRVGVLAENKQEISPAQNLVKSNRPVEPTDSDLSQMAALSQGDTSVTHPISFPEPGFVFPSLADCNDPIGKIIESLTGATWRRALLRKFSEANLTTIGHLASLSEEQVNRFAIRPPRKATLVKALEKYVRDSGKVFKPAPNIKSSQPSITSAATSASVPDSNPVILVKSPSGAEASSTCSVSEMPTEALLRELTKRVGVRGLLTQLSEQSEDDLLDAVRNIATDKKILGCVPFESLIDEGLDRVRDPSDDLTACNDKLNDFVCRLIANGAVKYSDVTSTVLPALTKPQYKEIVTTVFNSVVDRL